MEITREELSDIVQCAVDSAIKSLEQRTTKASTVNPTVNPVGNPNGQPQKSAYQRTESLLYHYNGFKRIVDQRREEIRSLMECGIPKRSKSIVEWSSGGNPTHDMVLPEEELEAAIGTIQASIDKLEWAIGLIDTGMAELVKDPYYRILELKYFKGLAQEEIALEFGCSQVTISNNKTRLVKELATKIFPELIIDEIMQ